MKECPFKYKENIVESTEESRHSDPTMFHGDWWKVTGAYNACKLMKNSNNKCVGESNCPIMKILKQVSL